MTLGERQYWSMVWKMLEFNAWEIVPGSRCLAWHCGELEASSDWWTGKIEIGGRSSITRGGWMVKKSRRYLGCEYCTIAGSCRLATGLWMIDLLRHYQTRQWSRMEVRWQCLVVMVTAQTSELWMSCGRLIWVDSKAEENVLAVIKHGMDNEATVKVV